MDNTTTEIPAVVLSICIWKITFRAGSGCSILRYRRSLFHKYLRLSFLQARRVFQCKSYRPVLGCQAVSNKLLKSSCGSMSSTINGPAGEKVSEDLARHQFMSSRCQSLALTSFPHVYPKTWLIASASGT